MRSRRGLAAVVALACVAAAAGCGLGPGKSSGSAQLLITREYGAQGVLGTTDHSLSSSENVLRMLDRNADVGTRYGGKFVQSINGIASSSRAGRRSDWFFYVNGVESPVGSADVGVRNGDRVWWDYHDWSSAMRVPAVVGSWPEPFAHGFDGKGGFQTRIDCLGAVAPCRIVQRQFAAAGVKAGVFETARVPGFDPEAGPTLRVLVGPWAQVGKDPAAAQIEQGPAQSGVFARFERSGGGAGLLTLDQRGAVVRRLGPSGGLVAAVRLGDNPPTWIVTGGSAAGVNAAAGLVGGAGLSDRFAVAAPAAGAPVPLPVVGAP